MAKFLIFITILYLISTTSTISQIVFPSFFDSIVAGKEIEFIFNVKSTSIQRLEFSLDRINWYEVGRFLNQNKFNWTPPLLDIDSVYFRYEAYNFTLPEKIWSISAAHLGEVNSIDILPDDSIFLSASYDGRLYLWNLNTLRKVDSFVHTGRIFSARMFFDNSKVIFSSDSSVYFYNFSNPFILTKIWSSSGFFRTFAVCHLKKFCAFASNKGEIVVLDSNLKVVNSFTVDREIYSIAFSNSCQMIASGDYNGFVAIYDIATGEKLYEFTTNRDSTFKNVVWSVSFNAGDTLVVAGGIDGKVRIYNLKTKSLEYSFPSHTFHIRSAEFCDYAPVVTSASLDSTISQVLFLLNIPIHFPLKEEAPITFLKKISGGQFFLVGMRNGTIAFYKNFDFEHIIQVLALPYFIPIIAKCQSFQSIAGRMVSFPIILNNIFEVPLTRFFSDSSIAILNVPREHFGVYHPEKGELKFGSTDTIFSNIRSIGRRDTFAVVQAYTLHPWGERKESFAIKSLNFRGKKNIYWIFDTTSVEIIEKCKPLTNLMKFELLPRINFELIQDVVEYELKLKVALEKPIFCKFVLINSISGNYSTLFEGEMSIGEKILTIDVSNFPSGVYILLINSDFVHLAKKLIIIR